MQHFLGYANAILQERTLLPKKWNWSTKTRKVVTSKIRRWVAIIGLEILLIALQSFATYRNQEENFAHTNTYTTKYSPPEAASIIR